ncbi:MAG: LA_1612 family putative O-antigen biosynthesis protein [Betaproteobacteria bacterium]
MRFDQIKSRFIRFYEVFVVPPKIWRSPKKSDVLIYDITNMEALIPYLTGYRVEVIPLRQESVNIPCLLRAMTAPEFWSGGAMQSYIDAFIRASSPTILLTYIDNDPGFYTISNRFKGIKTVFVQNGTRGELGDVFGNLVPSGTYHVDYMLVHGEAVGAHYLRYISGSAIAIGSVKNNAINVEADVVQKTVVFVSQYSNRSSKDEPFLIEADNKPVLWDQFYAAEISVVEFLDTWCAENDWLLRVCGRDFVGNGSEKAFYADRINKCTWEYVPRGNASSSYKLIDSAELIVFIDSTLGYESIARGKKTAAFTCRGWSSNKTPFKFGWPANLPDSGPFWTHEINENEFSRIMNYLLRVSDADWAADRHHYAEELMEFDPGNKRFAAILSQVLPNRVPASCRVNSPVKH